MQDFIHLHVHTQYSILDGQAAISKLVDKAISDGMRGMAVTDHGNMFGIKEFFDYTNKKNGGIKDILDQGEEYVKGSLAFLNLSMKICCSSVHFSR